MVINLIYRKEWKVINIMDSMGLINDNEYCLLLVETTNDFIREIYIDIYLTRCTNKEYT